MGKRWKKNTAVCAICGKDVPTIFMSSVEKDHTEVPVCSTHESAIQSDRAMKEKRRKDERKQFEADHCKSV